MSDNGHNRAVLYARVSSDDRSKEGRNLASQIEMGREYAQARGYTITAELAEDDRGASGASFELPQLSAILAMAERKEIDVLVVRELDRLSRNLAKQLIVEETLRRAGVSIEYVLGEYPNTPEGNLNKHIRATIAEFEREKITERNVRGKRNVVKGGRVILYGKAPYGYRAVNEIRNGKNIVVGLVVYEPEAQIVRLIFTWYTVGDENGERLSSIQIAQRLSGMSVPTWSDVNSTGWSNWKKSEVGHWSNKSILCILHNEVYKGTWHYGKQKRDGTRNPRETWIPLEVPAIIASDQWEAAQEMCKRNVTFGERNVSHEYLMRYRVKCARNFSMLCSTVQANGSAYPYYASRGVKSCGWEHNCTLRGCYFRSDYVDALVWDCLKEYFRDPADLRNKLAEYNAGQDKINAPILALIQANEDLIAKNQAELTRIKDMCQAKIIMLEEAVDRKTRLETTVTKLEGERGELQARLGHRPSDEEIEDVMQMAYSISAGIVKADKSFEKRRRIIEALNVRGILKVEDGEKVCYASFILAQGEYSKRLVLPQRGNVLSVAPTGLNASSVRTTRSVN